VTKKTTKTERFRKSHGSSHSELGLNIDKHLFRISCLILLGPRQFIPLVKEVTRQCSFDLIFSCVASIARQWWKTN